MAAPSGIVWGEIKRSYGRIGIYAAVSSTNTTSNVSIQVWFWSKYSVSDSNNRFCFDNNATSATTVLDDVTIKTTNDSGDGWSTDNQVQIGTFSYSYDRTSAAKTIFCASALSGIDTVGSVTMTASTSYTIPALPVYVISYNANGGSGAPSSQSAQYGTAIQISSTKPTRSGYTFLGWGTSSTATSVAYASGATYSAYTSVTLYAVWRANTFTVLYDPNGGSGAPSSQTKTYGVTLTLSSTIPIRSNYRFLGWGTSASATTVAYAAGGSYTTNASIKLYAIWELAYTDPRVTGITIYRSTSAGASSDDGTYFKVAFSWETDHTISSINIVWTDTATASSKSQTISASGTSGTVNTVLGAGALSADSSYTVSISVADTTGSTVIIRTIPAQIYPIDFLSGGKGTAIGQPAKEENLFDVGWASRFKENVTIEKTVTANTGKISTLNSPYALISDLEIVNTITSPDATINSLDAASATIDTLYDKNGQKVTNGLAVYESAGIDPDTTLDHLILTNKNTPNGSFMYIKTEFYSTKTATSNRMQTAFPYAAKGPVYYRLYNSSSFSGWSDWMAYGSVLAPGNTFTLSYGIILSGYVSGSSANVLCTLYLGMPVVATGVRLSGGITIRGVKGYFTEADYTNGILVTDSTLTCSAKIADAAHGIIYLNLVRNTAFSNVTNNTPVSVNSLTGNPLVLTFT